MRRGSPVVVSMSMTNAASAAASAGTPDQRSPFVRLAELIADVKPGKPAIPTWDAGTRADQSDDKSNTLVLPEGRTR